MLQYGCLVVNAPTANTVAAAEHGIATMCALARNVAQADASMKAGKWERSKFVGVSLVDKTLAIMGFGKVGSSKSHTRGPVQTSGLASCGGGGLSCTWQATSGASDSCTSTPHDPHAHLHDPLPPPVLCRSVVRSPAVHAAWA